MKNVEIDYRTSDQPDFVSYSEDPTKFSNDICDEGRSKITLKLGFITTSGYSLAGRRFIGNSCIIWRTS